MKTLYLDCSMGAAGDMLTAALLGLLPDPDSFVARLNSLGIPGVEIKRETSVKCGISGTHISVRVSGVEEGEEIHDHDHDHDHSHDHSHDHDHDHEKNSSHHHSGMRDIEHIVEALDIPGKVRRDILAVYGLIAAAESEVHGVPVSDIHFHEVGTMDAIADVTAVCLLINELSLDRIISSPVHVGSGHVHCAHGILPVPAPATALLLKGIPIYGGSIQGELCTPTGAALLKYFVSGFGDMPVMSVDAIGYGMGKKDFPQANCVRAMLGDAHNIKADEKIYKLECNVDDMTAEDIAYAAGVLAENGARDVYTVPVGMKKNRVGSLISVLCLPEDREKLVRLMFRHTSTIGIREMPLGRYVLDRSIEDLDTPFGSIQYKRSSGHGVTRVKFEHDGLVKLAEENGMSLEEARAALSAYGDDPL